MSVTLNRGTMKPRRVVLTIEVVTDLPIPTLQRVTLLEFDGGEDSDVISNYGGLCGLPERAKVNVIREKPAKKAKKTKR